MDLFIYKKIFCGILKTSVEGMKLLTHGKDKGNLNLIKPMLSADSSI